MEPCPQWKERIWPQGPDKSFPMRGLGTLLNLPMPQFSPLQNGNVINIKGVNTDHSLHMLALKHTPIKVIFCFSPETNVLSFQSQEGKHTAQ